MQTSNPTTQTVQAEIAEELTRLQIHAVNLVSSAGADGHVVLRGSLLAHWGVPASVDGVWFLRVLRALPDFAGPRATMDAYCAAYTALSSSNGGETPPLAEAPIQEN